MISADFESWIDTTSGVRVHKITDGRRPVIHRFYDTSPISPTGRYIALTEFPYDDRLPAPGDCARVFVVDLTTANEIYSTYTAAWDTQVGAHVQWGLSDNQLFFNRMDEVRWRPYGVMVQLDKHVETKFDDTIYVVSPDGSRALTPCLKRIGLAQPGYGVITPDHTIRRNSGAPDDDGLHIVDTSTGRSRLLVSFARLFDAAALRNDLRVYGGSVYGFHAKWNLQGDRIMFIARLLPSAAKIGRTRNYLFTFNPDGSDIALALTPEAWEGGHHPNWCPDGRSIVMNLIYPRPSQWRMASSKAASRVARKLGLRVFPKARRLAFVSFDQYGNSIRRIGTAVGSGHPTVDPSGRLLVSDAYLSEEVASGNGSVPIRAVRMPSGPELTLFHLNTVPKFSGPQNEYRIDPHPAWDMSGKYLTINASQEGCRSVYVANLTDILEGT